MQINTSKHENISALLDGELTDAQLDQLMVSSGDAEFKQTWDVYQHIADVLHSDDLAIKLSSDFSNRFAALLNDEPVIIAPKIRVESKLNTQSSVQNSAIVARNWFNRAFAVGGLAAVAAAVFVVIHQINPLPGATGNSVQLARVAPSDGIQINHPGTIQVNASGVSVANEANSNANGGQLDSSELRDPRIDSYLLAHQKFSPAIDKGTHYVNLNNSATADK